MTQLQEPKALGRIVELVRDLRNRCAWDATQTRETLRPYLVEEVLELDHAISNSDENQIRAELGDVLLHLAFQIAIGEETGTFGAEDVVRGTEEKMWRRHPHLFGDGGAATDDKANQKTGTARQHPGWERLKLKERDGRSMLDGLPPTLPTLLTAFRLQERAAGVGFDWPDEKGPREKVTEELSELDHEIETARGKPAHNKDRIESELGDLMFAVINLSRKLGVDPRTALEKANRRFSGRFKEVERLAEIRGVRFGEASLEELDVLWEEAKKNVD